MIGRCGPATSDWTALGGGVVKESALGQVPRATDADRVGGLTAQELRVRCPSDTIAKGAVCVERSRAAASWLLWGLQHM